MTNRNSNETETLISVIVPVYNVEVTLDRCVNSIVHQTYSNLQIILVDDGSPDNCPEMCDVWASRDSRIEVIHKANGGLSDARNVGIANAVGQYIMFVDSDDYIELNSIQILVDTMQREHADLVICSIAEENADGKDQDNGSIIEHEMACDAHQCFRLSSWNWQFIPAWNKLYTASLWQNVRFPQGYIHEDEFVFHEIVNQCSTIVVLPDRLYHYVDNSSGIMHAQFSVRNLARLKAYCRRLRYFIDLRYGDCVGGVFANVLADLGRCGLLVDWHPESERQVKAVVAMVRSLPFQMIQFLSVPQKIRFLELKFVPGILIRQLASKQRKGVKDGSTIHSLR